MLQKNMNPYLHIKMKHNELNVLCVQADTGTGANILTFEPLTIGHMKRASEIILVVCPR